MLEDAELITGLYIPGFELKWQDRGPLEWGIRVFLGCVSVWSLYLFSF